jgi:hypothetical protein
LTTAFSHKYRKNFWFLEGLFQRRQIILASSGFYSSLTTKSNMKFGTSSRRFEFTFEKTETYSVTTIRNVVSAWCGLCESETRMSSPEAAAGIVNISRRKVYAGIEDGTAHFTEAQDGSILVCLRSLEQKKLSE